MAKAATSLGRLPTRRAAAAAEVPRASSSLARQPPAKAEEASRVGPHRLGYLAQLIRRHPVAVGGVLLLAALAIFATVLSALPPAWRSPGVYIAVGNLFLTGITGYALLVYSLVRTARVRSFLLAQIKATAETERKARLAAELQVATLEQKLRSDKKATDSAIDAASATLRLLIRGQASVAQAKLAEVDEGLRKFVKEQEVAAESRAEHVAAQHAAEAYAKLAEVDEGLRNFVKEREVAAESRAEHLAAQRAAEAHAKLAEVDEGLREFVKEREVAAESRAEHVAAQRAAEAHARLAEVDEGLREFVQEREVAAESRAEHLAARHAAERDAELEARLSHLDAEIDSVRAALATEVETAHAAIASGRGELTTILDHRHGELASLVEERVGGLTDLVERRQSELAGLVEQRGSELTALNEQRDEAMRAEVLTVRETLTNLSAEGDRAMASRLESLVGQAALRNQQRIESVSAAIETFRAEFAQELQSTAATVNSAKAVLATQIEESGRAAEARLLEAREALSSALETSSAATTSRLEGLVTQRSADVKDQLGKLMSALEGRVSNQARAFLHLNASNASRARPHLRFLSNAAVSRLEKHWAPLFGFQLPASALSYLAHQICLAEDLCEGRLATTIETAMLRLLAFRSLRKPAVELIEIGALFGLGSGLLHRLRGDDITHARLTLVDPLTGYYGRGEPDLVTGLPITVEILKRNLRGLGVPDDDVAVLQGLSTDEHVVGTADQRRYDFVLIDGDHSGEGVRRDFELYGPMVQKGGLVVFDDYETAEWPEIKPAIDDAIASTPGWEWVGSEWRAGIARRTAVSPSRDPGRPRRRTQQKRPRAPR